MRIRHRQSGQILARMGQTFDDPEANRIAIDCEHDRGFDADGNQRTYRLWTSSDDHVEIASRQFVRELAQTVAVVLCPQIVDRDIAAFNQSILCQAELELFYLAGVQCRWARCAEICYARYPIV